MLLDEFYELVGGCDHRNASSHHLLANIEINLAGCATNIPKVCEASHCKTI